MVRQQRDGRVVANRFWGGRKGPAVSLPGPAAGPQTRSVCLVETEMRGLVRSGFRSAALRSDEHVLRRGDGAEPESAAGVQPGWAIGLCAVGDRAGGDAGWIPA